LFTFRTEDGVEGERGEKRGGREARNLKPVRAKGGKGGGGKSGKGRGFFVGGKRILRKKERRKREFVAIFFSSE